MTEKGDAQDDSGFVILSGVSAANAVEESPRRGASRSARAVCVRRCEGADSLPYGVCECDRDYPAGPGKILRLRLRLRSG